VRAGDRQHPAVLEHLARQPFRAGGIGNVFVQQRFDHGLAARHDIADDDDVRLRAQLGRLEPFDHLDPESFQLRAHRRVDVAIGAGDTMAGGARDGGDAAHERAADAQDMHVHRDYLQDLSGEIETASRYSTSICRMTSATLAAPDHSRAAFTTWPSAAISHISSTSAMRENGSCHS
jgi:hypothetical protein